jgi:folate-binding protein YgfZ
MVQTTTDNTESPNVLAISVSGPDAGSFLQGQITCDVTTLEDGQYTLGAYCNIKGKVESLFYLIRNDDTYFLYLHPDLADPTLTELKKYAVFSKVAIELCEIALPPELARSEEQQILAQIPQLYPETVGLFFPHDLNLPELDAVSFTKGCYRGQEIVARMQHRGNLKRRMYFFISSKCKLNPGDEITGADNTAVGKIVRVYPDPAGPVLGLAVVNDANIKQQLKAGNSELLIQKTLDI